MKRMASFLLIVFFFRVFIAMERELNCYDHKVIKKTEFYEEQIKYYLGQKNLTCALVRFYKIKHKARFLNQSIKKNIQNKLIQIILDMLPLSEEDIEDFKRELNPVENKIGLSSNDSSPRIEENSVDIFSNDFTSYKSIRKFEGSLDDKSILKDLEKDNEKQPKFIFLTIIIEKLDKLQKEIKQAQSILRMDCHDRKTKNFMQKWKAYCGLYKDLLNLNDRNGVNKGLLHYAVENDCKEILLYILEQGADIEIIDMLGNTPLLLAVKLGKEKIVGCLLEFNANPYMRDVGGIRGKQDGSHVAFDNISKGSSIDPLEVLHQAEKENQYAIKIAINKYKKQLTPEQKFLFLAQAGRLKRLKALVSRASKQLPKSDSQDELMNAFINYTDPRNGKSALHYAIERQERNLILYLIGIKADLDAQDFEGDTPLHYAVKNNYFLGAFLLLFGDVDEVSSDCKNYYKGAQTEIINKQGYIPEKIAFLLKYDGILKTIKMKQAGYGGYKLNELSLNVNKDLILDREHPQIASDFMPKLVNSTEKPEKAESDWEIRLHSRKTRRERAFSFSAFRLGSLRSMVNKKDNVLE